MVTKHIDQIYHKDVKIRLWVSYNIIYKTTEINNTVMLISTARFEHNT